jgi:hypothetical protein
MTFPRASNFTRIGQAELAHTAVADVLSGSAGSKCIGARA